MKLFTRFHKLTALIVLAVVLLSACAPAAATTPAPAPTEPPAVAQPTAVPTAAPTSAPTQTPTEAPAPTEPPAAKEMTLATTTSTQDSGLLDYLLPDFEKEFNIKINVIAVGSGQALQMGKDGDADVLLVHSPAAEKTFMDEGHGMRREDVMYNDFVIVGPESDPAGVKGAAKAAEAFKTIAESRQPFISRGDDSGTHNKEKSLWKAAGIETPAGDWYISAGQGMGAVLTMAEEMQGYTLSDRATYLAQTQNGLKLVILVEGDTALFNPYGVIAVDPKKNEKIQNDLANTFIDWIISVPTQEKIAAFKKEELGQSLFTPNSALWLESQPKAAGFKITGKVGEEKTWSEDEIKAMDVITIQAPNKDNVMTDYTGVLLKTFLDLAAPAADAATVVAVADDGYEAEIPLADLTACEQCLLGFNDGGGFRLVLPGFSTKAQVKGVVELTIQ